MLNNRLVLCIGNTTQDTDFLTTQYAKLHNSTNYGLINTFEMQIEDNGFYHASYADFNNITNFLNLITNFDHVIYFKQPKETYINPDEYDLTIRAVEITKTRLQIPVDEVDGKIN
jgi:hypothetical protein